MVDLDERAADRRVGVGEEVVARRLLALFVARVLAFDGGALPLSAGCSIRFIAVMIAACMLGSFIVATHSTPSRIVQAAST